MPRFSLQTCPWQTLLILVHLHLLRRLVKDTLEHNHDRTKHQLSALKTALPAFFGQVGYVSNHFLDSSSQAVKVFFQLHTFHTNLKHLPELISLTSFFRTGLQSVFLDTYTYGSWKIEKFLNYSGIITGLTLYLSEPSDLEFLKNPSSLFPRLKQIEVEVFEYTAVSMIEALKTNTTVTSVKLSRNSIEAESARALADALKVNASITSIDLSGNVIEAEGARALAAALKVNSSVTSVNLVSNYIGAEGVRALADALKVNHRVEIVGVDELYES
ncbi:hypothetical protein GEMRC1_005737 [Eukaryota sp. GEM-RC1]